MVRRKVKVISGVVIAIGLSVAAVTVASRPVAGPKRVVRAGVDHSPPFYSIQQDGSVKGLAVDVLNEAARRRGIRVEWVPLVDTPIDEALAKKMVDFWPLAGPTKSRRELFSISSPWLESDYVLISLAAHPVRNAVEANDLVVAHARLRMTTSIAQAYLPKSKFIVKHFRSDAVQAVCSGEAAASLVESLVLDAILLERPSGCENKAFKISSLPGAMSPLSIIAIPEARQPADELRNEISNLARDGFLSAKLDEWSPFSAQGTRSIWAKEDAEKSSRIYRIFLGLILVFASILAFETRKAFRLKRLAQESEDRYRNLAQQQQRTLHELQASEQRWQLALNGAGDGLWDWDLASGVVFRSPGWKAMLGYRENEIGASLEDWRSLLHPEDLERAESAIQAHLNRETGSYSCDYRLRTKDGSWRWVSDRGQAVWDENGKPLRIAGSHTDITTRKLEQETLSLEARTDALTGVWNRRELDRVLPCQSELAAKSGHPLTVCAFDLDHFKAVNDQHGHAAGDQVLTKFAQLLSDNLRKRDIICRTGGDEFVVILPETTMNEAQALASRVCSELRRVRFRNRSGGEFHVRCSFGLGELGAPDLLAAADELLYQAKQKAGRRIFAA